MKTATMVWHKPRCSDCDEPIAKLDDAMAAWLVDEHTRRSDPQVVHRGGRCGHAAADAAGRLPRGLSINDMPVRFYRQSPLQAVADALRSIERGGDVEQWTRWIGVVLGLPGGGSLTELALAEAEGEKMQVALVDRV